MRISFIQVEDQRKISGVWNIWSEDVSRQWVWVSTGDIKREHEVDALPKLWYCKTASDKFDEIVDF